MMQGKLATDQIDDEEDKKDEVRDSGKNEEAQDQVMEEEDQDKDGEDADSKREEDIERTQAQYKESGVLKPDQHKEHLDDEEMNEKSHEEIEEI